MVTSLDNLKNIIDISDLNLQIDHPNGTTTFIKKVGNLKLSDTITLYDVLYVPKYSMNLLSVHKLARDSKVFIGFDESECYIQDLHMKKTLGTSSQQGETESEDGTGESSSMEGIERDVSGDESLGNPSEATNAESTHASYEDNIVESLSAFEGSINIQNITSEPTALRKSGRHSNLPKKLSNYVLDKNVKYGIQKSVNYSKLSQSNYCFSVDLNKTIEPKTFNEACTNKD
ncbi:hypothetical protein Tco_0935175 [Tanacetum coccineum]